MKNFIQPLVIVAIAMTMQSCGGKSEASRQEVSKDVIPVRVLALNRPARNL